MRPAGLLGAVLLRRALARAAARRRAATSSGPALTTAARDGDLAPCAAYEQVAHWLGVGVANIIAALDPPLVVIGGGVSAAGDLLLEPGRGRSMAESLVGAGFRDLPELVSAELGPLAGVVGIADLARTAGPDQARR